MQRGQAALHDFLDSALPRGNTLNVKSAMQRGFAPLHDFLDSALPRGCAFTHNLNTRHSGRAP
ncbi:hypothetical protein [Aestuariivirga sp.]|uniref:hypothetical protein n=1 Tax=Aestuariivirga sp. TaxID=2650926 RepID=UPI0039E5C109